MMQFDDMLSKQRSAELFYGVLKYHPNLICLKVNKGVLSGDDAKAIGKILADFKFIRELDVSSTSLDVNTSKEIADGLMRAKQLEIFKCENNPSMGKTLDTIIYNLAFSPKIKLINLS
jgi:Ran GTPase-activating protein (RanGAP) involved in mRNA processing and transport